ncbi:hypothetical protein GCM10010495_43320 [Kitasatospora herbaricolor]|nr:hypothetical protein GCM10010495_43320 [Kitasatospora herbaricolor]
MRTRPGRGATVRPWPVPRLRHRMTIRATGGPTLADLALDEVRLTAPGSGGDGPARRRGPRPARRSKRRPENGHPPASTVNRTVAGTGPAPRFTRLYGQPRDGVRTRGP